MSAKENKSGNGAIKLLLPNLQQSVIAVLIEPPRRASKLAVHAFATLAAPVVLCKL